MLKLARWKPWAHTESPMHSHTKGGQHRPHCLRDMTMPLPVTRLMCLSNHCQDDQKNEVQKKAAAEDVIDGALAKSHPSALGGS